MVYMRQAQAESTANSSASRPHLAASSLARVARGDLCTGCGGCVAVAPRRIVMGVSTEGYLRPVQTGPVSAAEDARIHATCPGLSQTVEAAGRRDDALWGPYMAMHKGFANDPALRFAGASGGGLSGLAAWLIDSGTVQAVVQVKADPDRAVANVATISRSRGEILEAAGSRYAPAAPLAILPDIPAELTRLAFIGKPCDTAALRALAAEDPAVAARFPVILSFFCAGTPSLKGAEAVLKALGSSPEDAQLFRYRGNGWPGLTTVTRRTGETAAMTYHDSWGGILSKHVQHRCKICADGTGTAADIVCADVWECDDAGYPVFQEAEGLSLVVARTALGTALLEKAQMAGAITLSPFDMGMLAAIQPGQRNRRQALLARLWALRLLGRPVPRYRGLKITEAARQAGLRFLMRNFLGTLRRGLSK
ncbi:Coenzyme F420 hydrogenase/dehydrogenase, beta subunit C-terminal domain [Cereibacter sphaeroides]|uniref:Coenzyme F420 hydrogenase/dehydrogenase, beta subunit C-terminal domain n=1 Tax=Cereibacter sphaeroides TaxID=1063 RepID=UPI001F322952|nr:Coenzyme F420 hydrogenase/dehydrogenase, beta subunit C-terminal domain [Cereibacter sphaeroides]MCE6950233.1 Coenzyme F420 hydrogenase/dehydrogenase, beta subunit C-terminal domain [Cereibacter sphaeroides]